MQVEFTAERTARLPLYNSVSPSASLTRTDRNVDSASLTAQTGHHHTVIQTHYCLRCWKLSCSFKTFNPPCASKNNNTYTFQVWPNCDQTDSLSLTFIFFFFQGSGRADHGCSSALKKLIIILTTTKKERTKKNKKWWSSDSEQLIF